MIPGPFTRPRKKVMKRKMLAKMRRPSGVDRVLMLMRRRASSRRKVVLMRMVMMGVMGGRLSRWCIALSMD